MGDANTEKRIKGFTAIGSVRGQCGHLHKTHDSALGCLRADQRSCNKVHGYSDRTVVVVGTDGYLYRDEDLTDRVPGLGGITSGAATFEPGPGRIRPARDRGDRRGSSHDR